MHTSYPLVRQDAGVKELFQEISSLRRAWAEQTQLWEEKTWQCPKSQRLEHNCYETVDGKGSDETPVLKRGVRLKSKTSSESLSSAQKASGDPTKHGPQTTDPSQDILIDDQQRKELEALLRSIELLEKSGQSGSQLERICLKDSNL